MVERIGNCIVAGHICLDIIPEIRVETGFLEAIRPGHLVSIGAATMAPGGTVANTGLALHKLGINTRLMSKLGEDAFGQVLRARLNDIDPGLVREMRSLPLEDTSYSIILSAPDADRVFLHNTGANDTFGPEDIDYAALGEADLLHFGYPTAMARMYAADGVELAELLRRAKETGITTSLDTSMFDRQGAAGQTDWPLLLRRALPYVDIFLPSLDEILLMLRPNEALAELDGGLVRQLARELLDFGAGIVVLKQGQNGLYLRSGSDFNGRGHGRAFSDSSLPWRDRELWAPAFQTRVVGTTGAGDCAVGGFLAAVLRGRGPEEALTLSAAAGACNVEAADATSGLLTWPETIARLESGWQQHALHLEGWQFSEAHRLWIGPDDHPPEIIE